MQQRVAVSGLSVCVEQKAPNAAGTLGAWLLAGARGWDSARIPNHLRSRNDIHAVAALDLLTTCGLAVQDQFRGVRVQIAIG